MARVATPNLGLGTWVDGENPGAGDQVVDNTGLNGNVIKIDTAVGTEHNANGTHKDDKIEGRSLKAAIADGSTLEFSAATGVKTLGVKNAGITAAKMVNSGVFTGDATTTFPALTIGNGAITAVKLASDAVETAKIKDANVTTAKFEYKEFIGRISQAGTADPTVTVIKDTIGIVQFSRSSQGVYVLNDGAGGHIFTTGKSFVIISGVDNGIVTSSFSTDVSVLITTKNLSNAVTDSLLSSASIMVRVYP